MRVEVVCPDDVGPDDVISVARPVDGMLFECVVPSGIHAGLVFEVELPEAEALDWQAATLSAEQAQTLQAVTAALRTCAPLSQWVEGNCQRFKDYQGDVELPLEWTSMHLEFVGMVETRVEEACASSMGGSEALYHLVAGLQAGMQGNEEADELVGKLLALGDFGFFCRHMRSLAQSQASRRRMARGYPIAGSHMPTT